MLLAMDYVNQILHSPVAWLALAFQIWMIVDAARREEWMWALLIFVFPPLTGIFYFFLVYRQAGPGVVQGFELPGKHERRRIKELQAQIQHLDKAHHHLALGDIYFQQGKLDLALASYHSAFERDSEDADIRAHLGQCHLLQHRSQEARALLEDVCRQDPKHDYGYSLMALAEAYMALGESELAIATWEKVLQSNSYPRARVQLATLYLAKGQSEPARDELREAVTEDAVAPDFDRRRNRIWIKRAKSMMSKFAAIAIGLIAATTILAQTPNNAVTAPRPFDLTRAFPSPGASNVCPDTPLRLIFDFPPMLGTNGRIQIVDASDNSVVESIDVSSRTATQTIGGLPNYQFYPVIVTGNEAAIYPRNARLAYDKTYYVRIDTGVFMNGVGALAGLDDHEAWRFSTKAAPPVVGQSRLTIAADGAGDFCTVQGALDFIPAGNTNPVTLFLRKGVYTEMVFFVNKHAITLLGEDRKLSVIAYATNERFNPAGGNPYTGSTDPSSAPFVGGNIYHRGVFLAHRVQDLTIANLTIRNTTPQGGSQAEAIILNGTPTARAVLKDVDLYSFQDTLQSNGQAYVENCYIEGDVDFMWGTGPCFFEKCMARSLRSNAYYTQIRNPATNHGYVYHQSIFNGASGVMGDFISRIMAVRFPASEVVLIDCTLSAAVGPVAWQFQGAGDSSNVHFWEFNSRDETGNLLDVSKRLAGSRQLRRPDDAVAIANYSDPTFVLGNGWNPKTAAIFKSP